MNFEKLHELYDTLEALKAERDALKRALSDVLAKADEEREEVWSSMASEVAESVFPVLMLLRKKFPHDHGLLLSAEEVVAGLGLRKHRDLVMRTFRLTVAEYRLAQYFIAGFSDAAIAELMNISMHTLKKHKNTLRIKAGAVGSSLPMGEILSQSLFGGAL
jgi:DNA-binding CsgD family transcriptional regulator